ncbi:MAG: hypothetical protein E6F98_10955 [Actinobacteria bacterium]|nr:MAG: hypothetical protein E6F98_10955 [Actinomycetota bacterium]
MVDTVVVEAVVVVAEVDEVAEEGWLGHALAFWLCDQHGGCVRATPAATANPVANDVTTPATTADPRAAVIFMPDEMRDRPLFLRVHLEEQLNPSLEGTDVPRSCRQPRGA